MSQTRNKPEKISQPPPHTNSGKNEAEGEVLSLEEASLYLKLPMDEVLKLVSEQGLPGRKAGREWRFLKRAIQNWLSQPMEGNQRNGIWSSAGALKNDPYLDEMLEEIDRLRGKPGGK